MSPQPTPAFIAASTRCAVQDTDPLSSRVHVTESLHESQSDDTTASPGRIQDDGQSCQSDRTPTQLTHFEVEWGHLSPAITALPSSRKIKQLVMRNANGQTSFRRSLPVETNGIDRCYATRPTFHQVISDIDKQTNARPVSQPSEASNSRQNPPNPFAFAEAMWESHFGVPRRMAWHTAAAISVDGVKNSMPRNFRPSDPERFGLTTNCVDVGPDFVHCALAATKRPPIQMFPPVGLLYTVVQGSLLLISWPHTEHNFEAWLKAIRTREQIDEWDVLDELENPRINMLSTGDSVYLAAGTIDVMMALSHVALTSRTIFNPASQELKCISRTCHRLIDAFIERQRIAFSPSDFREAKGMSTSFVLWTHFVSDWFSDKTGKTPRHGTSQQDLIDFCYDITRVWTKVGLYFELVREAGEPLRPLPAERLRVQPLRAPRPGARAQANVADNRPDNGNALAALCRLLQPRFSF